MPQSTFEELAVHLLLYVARVDGQVHYLEEATLRDLLGDLSTDDAMIRGAQSAFQANPITKIDEFLKTNDSIIQGAPEKKRQQLVEALFAVVNSDGKVQGEETEALRTIRKTLTQ